MGTLQVVSAGWPLLEPTLVSCAIFDRILMVTSAVVLALHLGPISRERGEEASGGEG